MIRLWWKVEKVVGPEKQRRFMCTLTQSVHRTSSDRRGAGPAGRRVTGTAWKPEAGRSGSGTGRKEVGARRGVPEEGTVEVRERAGIQMMSAQEAAEYST